VNASASRAINRRGPQPLPSSSEEDEEEVYGKLQREKSTTERKLTLKRFRAGRAGRTSQSPKPPTEVEHANATILKELTKINNALLHFRDATNREIKSLGSHIVRLEDGMPEAEKYRIHEIEKHFRRMNSQNLNQPQTAVNSLPGRQLSTSSIIPKATPVPREAHGVPENAGDSKEERLAAIFQAARQTAQTKRYIEGVLDGDGIDPVAKKNPNQRNKKQLSQFIIRGVNQKNLLRKKFGRMIIWSQDERAMCWGLVPIWGDGPLKTVMELATLTMVAVSVLVIVIQSYNRFDPERCDTTIFQESTDHDLNDLYAKVVENYPWGSTTTTTTAENGSGGSGAGTPTCKAAAMEKELYTLQVILVIWFSIEYVLRWVAVRPDFKVNRPYSRSDFFKAKYKYTTSFMPIIDLLSVLPFYLTLIIGDAAEGSVGNLLMILKVVRILRIFKLTKNNRTLTDVLACLTKIVGDLIVFFVVIFTLAVLISTTMFFVEKGNPEGFFSTIPECMYWSIITFTSVGYGDRYPVTDNGRIVAGVASLVGTIMMNFPIALIILSFDEVYNIRKQREERASTVVQKVFKWSNRHKGKYGHNDVKKEEGAAVAKGWFKRKNKVDNAASGQSLKRLASSYNYSKRVAQQNVKAQSKAKAKLKDMILHPHNRHKRLGNGAYNGREHFLASKFTTKWIKATGRGRDQRQEAFHARAEKRRASLGLPKPASVAPPPPPATETLATTTLPSSKIASGPTENLFVPEKPQKEKSEIVPLSVKISVDSDDFFDSEDESGA